MAEIRIVGLSGALSGDSMTVSEAMPLIMGRNTASCNVLLPNGTKGISGEHCKIEQGQDGLVITDLGSSYGTFVNGTKIVPYRPFALKSGDVFYLASKKESFLVTDGTNDAGLVQGAASGGVRYVDARRSGQVDRNKPKVCSIIAVILAVVAVLSPVFAYVHAFPSWFYLVIFFMCTIMDIAVLCLMFPDKIPWIVTGVVSAALVPVGVLIIFSHFYLGVVFFCVCPIIVVLLVGNFYPKSRALIIFSIVFVAVSFATVVINTVVQPIIVIQTIEKMFESFGL